MRRFRAQLEAMQPTNPAPSRKQVFVQRSISSLILLALLAAVVLTAKPVGFIALVSVMIAISSHESSRMLAGAEAGDYGSQRWPLIASCVYVPLLGALLLYAPGQAMKLAMLSPAVVAIGAFCLQMNRAPQPLSTLNRVAAGMLSFIYPGWSFAFILFVLLKWPQSGSAHSEIPGLWAALWLIGVTKITDIGAYVSGSLFGKHKLIPHISPKKTVEGLLGALVIAVGFGVGLAALQSQALAPLGNLWQVAGLSLVLALFSVMGDLAGSLIKRSLGVKDSGHLLPGIGGLFDLIDSPAFTVPLFVLFCM